ncbi:MAG: pyrimidine 5'-nucleotidase [Pseudomonadota bacterium]
MGREFSNIDTWLFDLDETLYPPELRLFDQIDKRMTAFVMDALNIDAVEADDIRARYYHEYGTTLSGLMNRHGMNPFPFLDHVHDIDLTHVSPAPHLAAALDQLPGRKLIYTNGSKGHAEQVAKARGIDHLFDDMLSIEDANFIPKPEREAFDLVFDRAAITPVRTAFFEDTAKNLREPAAMGVATVLIRDGVEPPDFVDLHCSKLEDALTQIMLGLSKERLEKLPLDHD